MNIKYLVKILALLTLGLFVNTSYAAGQITGVSAPALAAQDSTVRITVNGKGRCGSRVSFGDGTSYGFAGSAFPHRYTHRYTRARTMTIRVQARGAGCSVPKSGPPSTRITILARGAKPTGVGVGKFLRVREIPSGKSEPEPRRSDPALNLRLRGGIPVPTCGGRRATIVGTPGNDMLRGTRGDDVIHGLGGNDTIYGLGGNDIICGGNGNDKLSGGRGNDQLYGGAGDDYLESSGGNNKLYGGPGDDRLRGGSGNDKLWGGFGTDRCDGGTGTDYVDYSSCAVRTNVR